MRLLHELMVLSDSLRPGYSDSIGYDSGGHKEPLTIEADDTVTQLYRHLDGTPRQSPYQSKMDLFPNYRIIHRNEIAECVDQVKALCEGGFPLFADYSGNFIGILEAKVVAVTVEDPLPTLMHMSIDDFFITQIQFYKENVYSLDNHGFLESDFTLEDEVGLRLNPQCAYWSE